MKTLLKNGLIYDGSGGLPYGGDLLIESEKILAISPHINAEADRIIDLGGLCVAPGFIDAHSHNDFYTGYVFVNGTPLVNDGVYQSSRPGKVILK